MPGLLSFGTGCLCSMDALVVDEPKKQFIDFNESYLDCEQTRVSIMPKK
jgi:hypothetical protein